MIRLKLSLGILVFLFGSSFCQIIDTLKYYYPYNPDSANTMGFVEQCGATGYCEPVAVWFTPDSSVSDTSIKYYSIKTIRFCFGGNIFEDTTFTIHLGDDYPDQSNQIYKKYISVGYSDVNENFPVDGIYKFKDFDLSGIPVLRNIDFRTPFWVVLQNKVWALYNTTNEKTAINGSKHSFSNGLPSTGWENSYCDWIMEAIVEYQEVLSIPEPAGENQFPKSAQLFQNYPNPFNSNESIIKYQLFTHGFIELEIYSTTGQKIETIVSKHLKVGEYSVPVNFSKYTSGVYLCVLKLNGIHIETKKMTFIK
jgi:hypothetical protein